MCHCNSSAEHINFIQDLRELKYFANYRHLLCCLSFLLKRKVLQYSVINSWPKKERKVKLTWSQLNIIQLCLECNANPEELVRRYCCDSRTKWQISVPTTSNTFHHLLHHFPVNNRDKTKCRTEAFSFAFPEIKLQESNDCNDVFTILAC